METFRFYKPEFLWLGIFFTLTLLLIRIRYRKYSHPSLSFFLTTFFGLIAGSFAASRPQSGHYQKSTSYQGHSLILAFDISSSMSAKDVVPNRLELSKQIAERVLTSFSIKEVAIFALSESGFFLLPFTHDVETAIEMLDVLDPSITTSQGTDLGMALETMLAQVTKLNDKRGTKNASSIVLFSDGESHTEISPSILSEFRKQRLRITTIGVGTEQGVSLTLPTTRQTLRNPSGQPIITKLSTQTLKAMSETTGGRFFMASFGILDELQKSLTTAHASNNVFSVRKEHYPLLFLVTATLLSISFFLGRWNYVIRTSWMLLFWGAFFNSENLFANERRAIELYNTSVEQREELESSAEKLKESLAISQDPVFRKQALFNLGNTLLSMGDIPQAIQTYQEAYDIRTKSTDFDEKTNRKISDNLALAALSQRRQSSDKGGESESGENQNREPVDRLGPKTDYQGKLDDEAKKRMRDLIAADEREALKRMFKERHQNADITSQKPW